MTHREGIGNRDRGTQRVDNRDKGKKYRKYRLKIYIDEREKEGETGMESP